MASKDMMKGLRAKQLSVFNMLRFMEDNASKLDKKFPLSHDPKGNQTRQKLIVGIERHMDSHVHLKTETHKGKIMSLLESDIVDSWRSFVAHLKLLYYHGKGRYHIDQVIQAIYFFIDTAGTKKTSVEKIFDHVEKIREFGVAQTIHRLLDEINEIKTSRNEKNNRALYEDICTKLSLLLGIYNEVNFEGNVNTDDDLDKNIKAFRKEKENLQQKVQELESYNKAYLKKIEKLEHEKEQLEAKYDNKLIEKLKSEIQNKSQEILDRNHKIDKLMDQHKKEVSNMIEENQSTMTEFKTGFEQTIKENQSKITEITSGYERTIEENQKLIQEQDTKLAKYKEHINRLEEKDSKQKPKEDKWAVRTQRLTKVNDLKQPSMEDIRPVKPKSLRQRKDSKQQPVEGESEDQVLRPISSKPIPVPKRAVTPSAVNLGGSRRRQLQMGSDARTTKSMQLEETHTQEFVANTSYRQLAVSKSLEVKPSTDSKELFTFMRKSHKTTIASISYVLTASYFDPNELNAHAAFTNTGNDFTSCHRVLSCIDRDIADANYISFAYMYRIQGRTHIYTIADAYYRKRNRLMGDTYDYHMDAKPLATEIKKVLEEYSFENVMFCLAMKRTGKRAIFKPTNSTDELVKNLTYQLLTELKESAVL